jgi:glycine betaine/proline transport system permease protein
LPLARSAIMAGVNQTILLAVSMVVIAGFIGAGGLGQVVLRSLRDLDVGRAAEAGIAIVVMAIILDRFSAGLALPARQRRRHDRRAVAVAVGAAAAAGLVGTAVLGVDPPEWFDLSYREPVNSFVDWCRDNLFDIAGSGIGTGPFSDFLTIRLVTPLRELLSEDLAWPALLALTAAAGWRLGGIRLAATVTAALAAIGLLGMWELSMDTLAQVLVALLLCVLIGVPVGVWAARSSTVERVLRPVLDFLQTVPVFVLLVPVVILFNVGRIPGIIASVLYAIPATIRLTTLALRSVDRAAVEASTVYGATRAQTLRKVELPLARPLLLSALNQTIMLVLSMVVIAGLFGGGGLGLETVRGLRRTDSVGTGFEAGLAIVLLAVIIDRLTETAGRGRRAAP